MAERRMFAKTIIDSDAFLDMPLSSQALYFHLSMRGDDDGFINNPKKIQRMIGSSDDDLKLLIAKRFIIPFDSGVVVIKHWKIHNYIRVDRYKETVYQQEKSMLETKENNSYKKIENAGIPSDNQLVYQMETQVRVGKDSIVKDRDNIRKTTKFIPPTIQEIKEYCLEKNINVDADQFFNYFEAGNWVDSKGNKVKSWKQKLLTWNKYSTPTKKEFTGYTQEGHKVEDYSNIIDF